MYLLVQFAGVFTLLSAVEEQQPELLRCIQNSICCCYAWRSVVAAFMGSPRADSTPGVQVVMDTRLDVLEPSLSLPSSLSLGRFCILRYILTVNSPNYKTGRYTRALHLFTKPSKISLFRFKLQEEQPLSKMLRLSIFMLLLLAAFAVAKPPVGFTGTCS